ncbi:MAG: PAS domain-containing protein [Gemmatimonas sp.]
MDTLCLSPACPMPNRYTQQIDEVLEAVDTMNTDELDRLPYGMIQLDASGRILNYNAVESKLASLRKEDAIGKQFFTEIAPCTRVQEFYGRFKEGVIREALDTSFHFHFAFKQNPRDVTVRLLYSKRSRTVWVLISDYEGKPLATTESETITPR